MISVFSGTPSKTVRSSRAFLSYALYPTRDMQKARHHMVNRAPNLGRPK